MLSIDQIREYPLFAGLDETELANLSACLIKRTFAKGAYIYYPGNPGLNTYLVETGLVRLFFIDAAGQEYLLNLIGPNEAFGLPLLEDDQFRVTGAAAHQPSVVLSIGREDLLQLMDHSPQFMRNIYLELVTIARKLLLHTRSLVTLSLNGRLATMLLRLTKKDENQQCVINMLLSQEELAGWLGASRGRLNRAMNQLQQMGLIRVDGQKIVVLDSPGLEKMTEEQTLEQV